jgi:hypothetical protein
MNQLTGLCLIHLPYFNHAAASGKPDTGLLISRYDKDRSVRVLGNITSQIAFQSKPIGAFWLWRYNFTKAKEYLGVVGVIYNHKSRTLIFPFKPDFHEFQYIHLRVAIA